MSASSTNPTDILQPQTRKTMPEMDVTTGLQHAEERARDLYLKGKEKAIEAEKKFETYVGAHPIKSVLVAAGVGLAFGYLLGRRR